MDKMPVNKNLSINNDPVHSFLGGSLLSIKSAAGTDSVSKSPHVSKAKLYLYDPCTASSECIPVECHEKEAFSSLLNLDTKATTQRPKPEPLDGGWGWFIVIACMIMYAFIGGLNRSYGIIYIQLRKRFNSSAALTAWVGGATTAIRMSGSPIGTILGGIFTARSVAFCGALLFSAAYIISAFAPNIEFMFFSYSLFTGLGGALIFAPCVVMVTQYFDRRQGIANGLGTAGCGLGVFALPPIMDLVFTNYGFSGGMLVIAGVALNLAIAAALLRPLENNYPKVKNLPQKDSTKTSSRHVDLSMCHDMGFVLYAFSLAGVTMTFNAAQMLIPDLAQSIGVEEKNAVLLISILAIGDTLSSFLSGFFFDIPLIRRHRRHWFNLAIFISGLTCFMWGFANSYATLAVATVLHGLSNGCVISMRAVVLSDLVGADRLPNSFGVALFLQGLGMMVGPSIAGLLRDLTGAYTMSYVFCGVAHMICSLSFLAISFVPRYKPDT